MNPAGNWARLPVELRQRKQWVIASAGPDKTPLSINAHGNLYAASSTDPSQWLDFETAANYAYQNGYLIGYVCAADDPYTCIDLDVCDADSQARKGQPIDPSKWTTQEDFNRYYSIMQTFDSYTELSRYGKGLHIWVRGKVGKGHKRGGVELYSQERYLICTGTVILERPIKEQQQWLSVLASEIRVAQGAQNAVELVEVEAVDDDHTVYERARTADNGDKFAQLWQGRWNEMGFPSQSEADLALMSMLTFYSMSNEQCRRMFRASALGQREKAVKNNRYLDFTLTTIRSRQAREAKQQESLVEQGRTLAQTLIEQYNARSQLPPNPLHVPGLPEPAAQPPPTAAAITLAGPTMVPAPQENAADIGLPWPPGMAGQLAGFVYQSAPRPVKEVAIVAALGLLAGICGKAWYIPNSGLNVYIILVARSAVGKEAMHSGVSALMKAATLRAPAAMQFVDFSDFASGPALVKQCAAQTSFVNVAGEWGHKLKRIAYDDGRDAAMASLRMTMTNLYQKSGPMSVVGGITYSNKESNIASVSGVAFSMIGETTPRTFYESLTQSMMEDGFLSRFTVIEYDGERPALNEHPLYEPSKPLGDALGAICLQAHNLIGTNQPQGVGRSEEAAHMMKAFELECDQQINSTKDESWRQMWNRASLKVMRISALLAVADNWLHPRIEAEHTSWALELIRRDIAIMKRRLESGDVGTDDSARERKILSILHDYMVNGAPASYKVPTTMRDTGMVPHKYLQMRTHKASTFTTHKQGSTEALKQCIKSLIDSGYMLEIPKEKVIEGYGFQGKCYRILNLPDYDMNRLSLL